MIRLSVLASSSKGNSSLVCTPECNILIDAGISARRIKLALEECGLHPNQLDAILITHEHHDHCRGLGQLDKKHQLHLYCTRHTGHDLRGKAPNAIMTYLTTYEPFTIKDLCITPISTHHDALDPLGFTIEHKGLRLGYVTDTGHVCDKMIQELQGLHGLYLESNYDPDMLQNSGRSHALIGRIANNFGHLSNNQAAELVKKIAGKELQHLILGHLSPDCNSPQLAYDCMKDCLDQLGLMPHLQYARATTRTPWAEIK